MFGLVVFEVLSSLIYGILFFFGLGGSTGRLSDAYDAIIVG